MQKSEKENKTLKLAKAIESMKIGEGISPTPLSKKCGLHQVKVVDDLDKFDTLKEIGFETIRENGELKKIIRTDNSLDIRKELNSIKNEINNLNTLMNEVKSILRR
jgi:hypothetical protein